MILQFNYEELRALKAGAHVLLDGEGPTGSPVLAPSERRARVEALLLHLEGDLSLSSLDELRGVQVAITAIVECLRAEMEFVVVTSHPADEGAVAAYFDFAHAFTVAHRVGEMATEMEALIELMTGSPPTADTARSIRFPD